MSIFIYLLGLAIGVIAFLYILSAYDKGKKTIKGITGTPENSVKPEEVKFNKFAARAPGTRMCPLCRSELSKYEALYASKEKNADGEKILIHGCRYCYKPDEEKSLPRKSDM